MPAPEGSKVSVSRSFICWSLVCQTLYSTAEHLWLNRLQHVIDLDEFLYLKTFLLNQYCKAGKKRKANGHCTGELSHISQLSLSKTKLLVSAKPTKHHSICIHTESPSLAPSKVARNLGVMIDDQLAFKDHVTSVARTCRCALLNIRKIRPYRTNTPPSSRERVSVSLSVGLMWPQTYLKNSRKKKRSSL